MNNYALLVCVFILGAPVYASEPSVEELERWFESDDTAPPKTDNVNEGKLVFLSKIPDKRIPTVINNITITENSLLTGWVTINQCYQDLDPISAVEIVYRYRQMRNLKIKSSKNIHSVRLEGNSVQLNEVNPGAGLCVNLQAQILYLSNESKFELRNGPFERKFLDGYYPLYVQLKIQYPSKKIVFITSEPHASPGFIIREDTNQLIIDTWFEGKLTTKLIFRLKD